MGSHIKAVDHTFQPHCQNCSLSGLCLPLAVDQGDVERLDDIIERGRPLRRAEHVYRAGEPFTSLFAVRSGSIKTFRITAEGEEQIMGFHLPGELFGLGGIASGEHMNSALALETAAICEIPFERMAELSSEVPGLQRHMFQLMSQEISDDQQLMILLSKKTAEERIASLLLGLSSRFRKRRLSAYEFRLPMSRGDIGNYLGLVVETVSRVFTRMQQSGTLEVEGKNVRIIDPKNLAEMAGTHWQHD